MGQQLRPEALVWVAERTGVTQGLMTSMGRTLVPLWLQGPDGTMHFPSVIPRQRDI